MNERFSQYLRIKGLSMRRLSELSGVSVSVISRFCGGSSISTDKLLRLLQVCDDLSLEWLFYSTGEMIRKCDGATVNVGSFAGADVAQDNSVVVKNSNGVNVNPSSKENSLALVEKDRIILEKDRIISERDATIQELLKKLLDK